MTNGSAIGEFKLAKRPRVSISEIEFSGGDCFQINKNEKIIIVGPNNSGKSQALKEIFAICQSGIKPSNLVIKGLQLGKEGSVEELRNFLDSKAELVGDNYRYKNWQINQSHIQFWNQDYLQHQLTNGFVKNIDARERLGICDQQNSISPRDQKSKPQHILYDDDALMGEISEIFRDAFGKDLMFDFRGGSKLPIHVGEKSAVEKIPDRASDSYSQAVRKFPLLDMQGDGMKSYCGILFEAVVSNLDITLIDEPEAFLHPPQMRRLGETLSSKVKGQLLVATHSSDILRGFLEGTRGNIRILRIHRDQDVNLIDEATPDAIKELWEKPELRYSNSLEGIFHEQTIICEDDSDCRLVNSVADYLASSSSKQWPDTAYVPTGGKYGVPKIAEVLRNIGVPVKVIFDLDFLSEQDLVESTVKAFGGNWDDIKPFWTRVDSAVRGGDKPKTTSQIKAHIKSILDGSKEEDLPRGDVIEAMKRGKPWYKVKKYGTRGMPKGHAQKDYKSLRDSLEDIGIYVVPVGEVENFCPDLGSHGPKFVTKLLSNVPLDDERLGELRDFVEKVHI